MVVIVLFSASVWPLNLTQLVKLEIAMSNISKPVDWEVFSIPPIKPVQYFSILTKKREFSQLIERYNSQVFKHGYLHYCGIVPKNTSSSLNNRYEIFVLFFDETPNTSFIGFRVKVSKETFLCESNSLLLFLKRSNKAVYYSMNNNCIHVHCGTNAWELFYLLYDDYLRRYVITIIGTQFFYHFVYSYCIQREKQMLEMLHKGSKIIRVSKMSVYYKIRRKRKISVTDLIYMTLNMPKSKRYTISCFGSKKEISYSDLKNGDFYTVTGSKINVSELMLKKYKNQNILLTGNDKNLIAPERKNSSPLECAVNQHSQSKAFPSQKRIFSNTALKRKFDEIENYEVDTEPGPSTPKWPSVSFYDKNKWEQYQTLKPYAIKSYSVIPCTNPLVPSFFKNGDSSHFHSSSHLLEVHSKTHMPFDKELIQCTTVATPCEKTHIECIVPKPFPPDLSELKKIYQERYTCRHSSQDTYLKETYDSKSSVFFQRNTDDANQENESDLYEDDVSFTTAAGKAINVSSSSMLKAHKLITNDFSDNEQRFTGRATSDLVRCNMIDKINYPSFRKESVTEDIHKKILHNVPHSISLRSENKILPKQFKATSTNTKGFKYEDSKDFDFSTAAGRTINISNAAMKAAQKLIEGVSDEEKQSEYNENVHLHSETNKMFKKINIVGDTASTSAATDLDMDNTLIEKFFEDDTFFEKDCEITDDNLKKNDTDVALESKNKNLPGHKPRKSLGGRRSMRYFPDKGSK